LTCDGHNHACWNCSEVEDKPQRRQRLWIKSELEKDPSNLFGNPVLVISQVHAHLPERKKSRESSRCPPQIVRESG